MIEKLLSSTVRGSNQTLNQGKEQALNIVRQTIKKQLETRTPNPDELTKKLLDNVGGISNPLELLNKAQSEYDKISGKIDPIIDSTTSALNKLEGIQVKINSINESFATINGLMSTIRDLIPVLKGLALTATISLAAQTGPAANGAVIVKLNDRITKVNNTVARINAIIDIVANIVGFFQTTVSELLKPINRAIDSIKKVSNQVINIKTIINKIILDFLKNIGETVIPALKDFFNDLQVQARDFADKLKEKINQKKEELTGNIPI